MATRTGAAFPARIKAYHLIPVIALYGILLLVTSCSYWGDTYIYVSEILGVHEGRLPAAHLWEFGHLFWRPLADSVYQLMPLSWFDGHHRVAVHFSFAILSAAGGLLAVIYFFRLALLASKSFAVAMLTTLFLVCCNTFLNLFQGSVYTCGLGFVSLGLWLALSGVDRGLPARRAVGAGLSLAGAILLWFPFCLVAPAVVAAVLVWRGDVLFWKDPSWRRRLLFCGLITAATVIPLAAAYAWAIHLHHFTTLPEIQHWITDARHELAQNRRLVRFFFGLPRTFFDMGNDGILFKRYIFHDPYAQVTLFDLVRLSLIKIAAFYSLVAWLLFSLLRTREGRTWFTVLAVAAGAVFFFALVLFETGSPERYIGVFPFLAPALAYALASPRWRLLNRAVAAFLLMVSVGAIVQAHVQQVRLDEVTTRRLNGIKQRLTPGSVLFVLTSLEDVFTFGINRPYHPLNRPDMLPIHIAVFAGSDNHTQWREDFAFYALRSLEAQGEAWLSARLLAPAPRPEWNWTEGDVPFVRWKDLPAFFAQFEYAESLNEPDGFVRLADSERNRELLRNVLKSDPR